MANTASMSNKGRFVGQRLTIKGEKRREMREAQGDTVEEDANK